jgi:hypothetical protein
MRKDKKQTWPNTIRRTAVDHFMVGLVQVFGLVTKCRIFEQFWKAKSQLKALAIADDESITGLPDFS